MIFSFSSAKQQPFWQSSSAFLPKVKLRELSRLLIHQDDQEQPQPDSFVRSIEQLFAPLSDSGLLP